MNSPDTVGVLDRRLLFPVLARAVAWVHTAIVLFFALGWMLPWPSAHWAVIGGGVLLQSIWCFLRDNCPLTLLERWLSGTGPEEPGERRFFVSGLLSTVLRRPVSDRAGNAVVYSVLYSSMLICAVKLAA